MKMLKARIEVIDMKSTDDRKDQWKFPRYMKEGFCDKFKVGDVFIEDFDPNIPMPADFPCKYAWQSLLIYHPFMLRYIEKYGLTEDNLEDYDPEIACCVDGLKPVFFKLSLVSRKD